MDGWFGRRTRRLLEALTRLLEPEILRSEPVERSGMIPAVRGWSLRNVPDDAPPALASLIVSYRWDGPVVRGGKPSPILESLSYSPCEDPRPDVGFFALKPGRTHAELRRYPSLVCVGAVSLFGRVVEHAHGYRAEAVRVDSVCVIEETLEGRSRVDAKEIAAGLEQRYRCEARVVGGLRAAVAWSTRTARETTSGSPSPEIDGG